MMWRGEAESCKGKPDKQTGERTMSSLLATTILTEFSTVLYMSSSFIQMSSKSEKVSCRVTSYAASHCESSDNDKPQANHSWVYP